MADEPEQVTSTLVRFPSDLYEKVKAVAESDDRSIHKTILRLVGRGIMLWEMRPHQADPTPLDKFTEGIVRGSTEGDLSAAEVSKRLATDHAKEIRDRTGTPCPHPKARVVKGQCQACGEKVA